MIQVKKVKSKNLIKTYENGKLKIIYSHLSDLIIVRRTIMIFNKALQEGVKHFILDFSRCIPPSFPNILVSITGLIEYYKNYHNVKIDIVKKENSYIDHTSLGTPYNFFNHEKILSDSIFDRVISFSTPSEVESITLHLLKQSQSMVHVESGVIVGTSWCLNEVMDNVFIHSKVEKGFIMSQIHKKQKHLVVSIFDYGQGILNSFIGSTHTPKDALESIDLAIQKGVTRDSNIGQGNGLWGLHEIVSDNKGILTITTGGGKSIFDYSRNEKKISSHKKQTFPSKINQTTLIDITINFDNLIDITKSLGGYEPFEKITREIEDVIDSDGWITIDVYNEASGTGTRKSGKKMRLYVTNLLNSERKPIILDFGSVNVISSSFADEFIGKLVKELGFVQFNNNFRVKNAKPWISSLIDKSILERLQFEKQLN